MRFGVLAVCAAVSLGELPSGYPSVPMNGVGGKVAMPLVGLGTWQYNSTVTYAASLQALKIGFRHIDTAFDYDNQVGVGRALQESGLAREEYFITSKIPGGLNFSASTDALNQCLQELKLDYVDLMLLHFPFNMQGKGSSRMRQQQWLALEAWAKAGKAKAIGVSHYCESHVKDILKVATLPIAVDQVQYHVGMGAASNTATDDKDWIQSQGILYQSFSPLCGPCTPPDNTLLVKGDLVTSIGKAHNKSGVQVALRWIVQQGIPVIPKSSKSVHQQQDFDLFSWSLTDKEMAQLTAAKSPAVGGGPSPTDSGDCGISELVV